MNSKHLLKDNLIVFPSNEGKSEICDFLYQTCRILAKNNLVIVINIQKAKSLKEILLSFFKKNSQFQLINQVDRVHYFTPILILPFRRFPIIVRINIILNILGLQIVCKLVCRKYKRQLLWFFFPQLSYLHRYFGKSWLTIYDVIDYYTSPNPILNNELRLQKQYLLKVATVTTAISETLKKTYYALYKRPIFVVPQGFNLDLFTNKELPTNNIRLPNEKPIVGFIGHLNERLDFDLLHKLIGHNPQWQFVFIGPKETNINVSLTEKYNKVEKILSYKNVTWLDQQPKQNIPQLIEQFSISMIPYDVRFDFNRYCYPMKIFEYFYVGSPVISTPIEELKKMPDLVVIGKDWKEWEEKIIKLLAKPWPKKLKQQQLLMSQNNSWESKIESISQHI